MSRLKFGTASIEVQSTDCNSEVQNIKSNSAKWCVPLSPSSNYAKFLIRQIFTLRRFVPGVRQNWNPTKED